MRNMFLLVLLGCGGSHFEPCHTTIGGVVALDYHTTTDPGCLVTGDAIELHAGEVDFSISPSTLSATNHLTGYSCVNFVGTIKLRQVNGGWSYFFDGQCDPVGRETGVIEQN